MTDKEDWTPPTEEEQMEQAKKDGLYCETCNVIYTDYEAADKAVCCLEREIESLLAKVAELEKHAKRALRLFQVVRKSYCYNLCPKEAYDGKEKHESICDEIQEAEDFLGAHYG